MQVVSELMWKKISAELVTIGLEHLAWSQLDYNAETGRMQLMENQAHAIEFLSTLLCTLPPSSSEVKTMVANHDVGRSRMRRPLLS